MAAMIFVVVPIPCSSGMTVVSVSHRLVPSHHLTLSRVPSYPHHRRHDDFSDGSFHHLPAPSARLAFSPALDTSESTISPTFSNFSPSTSSGYSIPSPDSAAVSTPSDADDAWNLIPYNVFWGHRYEEYRAGILPGPEGDCIFLHSPTPLRNHHGAARIFVVCGYVVER
ncbi:hypothetical protein DFH94DRAFT_267921 [Russula ochroleuca]|uniref:Uncharacterized protein n=1 Tax=Russula ochroleuca TaxID=152965 RepID=A0A9P5TD45_9AGAM|nr:hypothetical protein DFH94DRAFT_267921 [Russula ochroleuca]